MCVFPPHVLCDPVSPLCGYVIWFRCSSSRFICHIHDYTESINQQWTPSHPERVCLIYPSFNLVFIVCSAPCDHLVSGERLSPIQNTARPSAQPTISPLHGAHRWRRARACRDRRANVQECDKAEDRHGARASRIIRPGARAGYNDRHERESRGQWECGEELRPLHCDWGWANFGSWTV